MSETSNNKAIDFAISKLEKESKIIIPLDAIFFAEKRINKNNLGQEKAVIELEKKIQWSIHRKLTNRLAVFSSILSLLSLISFFLVSLFDELHLSEKIPFYFFVFFSWIGLFLGLTGLTMAFSPVPTKIGAKISFKERKVEKASDNSFFVKMIAKYIVSICVFGGAIFLGYGGVILVLADLGYVQFR